MQRHACDASLSDADVPWHNASHALQRHTSQLKCAIQAHLSSLTICSPHKAAHNVLQMILGVVLKCWLLPVACHLEGAFVIAVVGLGGAHVAGAVDRAAYVVHLAGVYDQVGGIAEDVGRTGRCHVIIHQGPAVQSRLRGTTWALLSGIRAAVLRMCGKTTHVQQNMI